MTSPSITGHCLCGALSYQVDGPVADVLHCHCGPCRRATGNFVAASRVALADLSIKGEEYLRWNDFGFCRYGFCGECGSHTFWVAADRPEMWSVQVGTIDDTSNLKLGGVWFAHEMQSHHVVPDGVPIFNGNDDNFNGESL